MDTTLSWGCVTKFVKLLSIGSDPGHLILQMMSVEDRRRDYSRSPPRRRQDFSRSPVGRRPSNYRSRSPEYRRDGYDRRDNYGRRPVMSPPPRRAPRPVHK